MTPLLAHADWSVAPAKRWMAVATPDAGGWRATLEPVGELASLLDRLQRKAGGAPAALGVDAPIGLPLALRGAHRDFPSFLRSPAADSRFFTPCDDPAQIGPGQPFYPRLPRTGVRRHSLLTGLRLEDPAELLRHCERRLGRQPAAAPMLWTLGANQVGKGAICLWRDLLRPAFEGPRPPLLWPFDGALADTLRPGRCVVAETYPANAMRQMGLFPIGSKRRQSDRARVAPAIEALFRTTHTAPDAALAAQVENGFGASGDGEDRFDAVLGLLRMLQVVLDPALDRFPGPEIVRWEGWILGRPVSID